MLQTSEIITRLPPATARISRAATFPPLPWILHVRAWKGLDELPCPSSGCRAVRCLSYEWGRERGGVAFELGPLLSRDLHALQPIR